MIILKQGRQPTLKMHAVLNGINFVYCMSYIYYLLSITKTSKVKIWTTSVCQCLKLLYMLIYNSSTFPIQQNKLPYKRSSLSLRGTAQYNFTILEHLRSVLLQEVAFGRRCLLREDNCNTKFSKVKGPHQFVNVYRCYRCFYYSNIGTRIWQVIFSRGGNFLHILAVQLKSQNSILPIFYAKLIMVFKRFLQIDKP